jgi:hypothetical protein
MVCRDFMHQAACPVLQLRTIYEAELVGIRAQLQILRHAEIGAEGQFLMDQCNPELAS